MLDTLDGEEVLQGELKLGEVLCLGVRVDERSRLRLTLAILGSEVGVTLMLQENFNWRP